MLHLLVLDLCLGIQSFAELLGRVTLVKLDVHLRRQLHSALLVPGRLVAVPW